MRHVSRIALATLLLFTFLLVSTINFAYPDRVVIPLSDTSGVSGVITLDITDRTYAGDRGTIQLRIDLEESTSLENAAFTVHLESGVEEVDPFGPVVIHIQNLDPVSLDWQYRTANFDVYPGMLWVWLESRNGRELLLAREIHLQSGAYLGVRVIYFRIAYSVLWLFNAFWLILTKSREKNQKNP